MPMFVFKSGKEIIVSLWQLAPLGETTEAPSVEAQDFNVPILVDMSVPEPQNDNVLQSTSELSADSEAVPSNQNDNKSHARNTYFRTRPYKLRSYQKWTLAKSLFYHFLCLEKKESCI